MPKKRINFESLLLLLSVIGIGISLYLTYAKLTATPVICTLDCGIVQSSEYSEIFGIPVAVFGILYYLALFVLITKKLKKAAAVWLVWGILFSLYLTYLELFVIHAVCEWCVASFINIIVIGGMYYYLNFTGVRRRADDNS